MTRELGMFPYSEDGVIAPHTDGTLNAVPTGIDLSIDSPNSNRYTRGKNSGTVIKGTIGDTDYVYCDSIAYGVFAGDS